MDSHISPEALLKRPPDQILSCQQCGINFVWTGYEQESGPKPQHCPGCRHLQTLTHTWGIVKWFDARKGFGFILTPDGEAIYVRRRDLKKMRTLRKNQLVRFKIGRDAKGARAVKVQPG